MRKLPKEPENWATRQTILLFRLIDEVSETNFSGLRTIVEQAEQIEIDLTGPRQIERDVGFEISNICLLYTSPSPRDQRGSRMPSSA